MYAVEREVEEQLLESCCRGVCEVFRVGYVEGGRVGCPKCSCCCP